MQSAWYRVTVSRPDLLLALVGNCGGALQLALQAGAILLLAYELLKHRLAPGVAWWGSRQRANGVRHASDAGAGMARAAACAAGRAAHGALAAPHAHAQQQRYSLTGDVFMDPQTGQHFALLSPGPDARGAQHACMHGSGRPSPLSSPAAALARAPTVGEQDGTHCAAAAAASAAAAQPSPAGGSGLSRGLAWLSLSGSGGVAAALRGLSVGGHTHRQQGGHHPPGTVCLSSSGAGGGTASS
jgi:hypothetical protein